MRFNQFEYRNINGRFPEIVRWKSDLEDSPEYCYTLLLWKLDREGYSIEFIGNRPFNEDASGDLWALMAYAQAVLDAEFKLKETLE